MASAIRGKSCLSRRANTTILRGFSIPALALLVVLRLGGLIGVVPKNMTDHYVAQFIADCASRDHIHAAINQVNEPVNRSIRFINTPIPWGHRQFSLSLRHLVLSKIYAARLDSTEERLDLGMCCVKLLTELRITSKQFDVAMPVRFSDPCAVFTSYFFFIRRCGSAWKR